LPVNSRGPVGSRAARHKRDIVKVIVGPTDAIIDRLPDVLELMLPTLTSCLIRNLVRKPRR
jgi:hypothetical protein